MATEPKNFLFGIGGEDSTASNQNLNYLTPAEQAELNRYAAIDAQAKAAASSDKKKASIVDILNGVGSVVGSLLGAKQAAQMNGTTGNYYPGIDYTYQVDKKSNTAIIIAVVVVVIIIMAIILLTRKKS